MRLDLGDLGRDDHEGIHAPIYDPYPSHDEHDSDQSQHKRIRTLRTVFREEQNRVPKNNEIVPVGECLFTYGTSEALQCMHAITCASEM